MHSGQHTFLSLESTKHPVVTDYDSTNGNLKLAVCDDDICSTSTTHTLDHVSYVGRGTCH
eukprot:m.378070 g.378070  ORF g.378070 m.378070 type:complete len:60 (+) comp91051_c0_seq1:356-535(+)